MEVAPSLHWRQTVTAQRTEGRESRDESGSNAGSEQGPPSGSAKSERSAAQGNLQRRRTKGPDQDSIDARGNLYVTESFGPPTGSGFASGGIWRISPGGAVEPWLRHETLNGVSDPLVGTPIGANGIVHVNGALYVGNTTKKTVVRVPILADGRPGAPTVVKQFEGELDFVDGITADVHGNLYPLMIGRYALVRLNPHTGDVTTLATAQDGLHLPASAAFGTAHGNRKAVYVTNFAFADPLGVGSGPAVVRVEVGIPGRTLTGAGGQ